MSGGTKFEGAGDGTSISPNRDMDNYPIASPLHAVNHAVREGVIWVNAAGNNAHYTWYDKDYTVSSTNFVEFTSNYSCNWLPLQSGSNTYQLRWDDDWHQLTDDFAIGMWDRLTLDGVDYWTKLRTSVPEQPSNARSNPYDSLNVPYVSGLGGLCLAIKVPPGLTASDYPDWILFHVLLGSELQHDTADASVHDEGGSLTNPAESANTGMLAVGAVTVANGKRSTWHDIDSYSSRGPMPEGTTTKPDLVGSVGIWSDIRQTNVWGTSAAAPHLTGMAALVMQQYSEAGTAYTPTTIANYLRSNAETRRPYNAAQGATQPPLGLNNSWGYGFAKLPAPPKCLAKPGTPVASGADHNSVTLT